MWIALLLRSAVSSLLLADTNYLTPISMTNPHLNEVASYSFYVKSTVALEASQMFYITFPQEYVTVTYSSCSITTKSQTSSCTLSLSEKTLSFSLPFRIQTNTAFTITIDDVQNPESDKFTGPFSLEVRSTDDTRDTSENKIFGQLAFDKVLSSTMAITDEIFEEYDGYTPLVDTLSTYALRLDLESDVDEGTWFLVELPDGWSKDFGQDSKCRIEPSRENTPAVEGNFYCDTVGQNVIVKGLGQNLIASNLDQSQLILVINDVRNPISAKPVHYDYFYIKILDQGTNRILSIHRNPTPVIKSGEIIGFQYDLLTQIAQLTEGQSYLLTFGFNTSHQIPEGGQITIELQYGVFNTEPYIYCYVYAGLQAKADGTYPKCQLTSKTITVYDFGAVEAVNTFIQIQGVLSMIEEQEYTTITTYDADGMVIDSTVLNDMKAGTYIPLQTFDTEICTGNTQTNLDIRLNFTPSDQVPLGTDIKMQLPKNFSFATTSFTCEIFTYQTGCATAGAITLSCTVVEINSAKQVRANAPIDLSAGTKYSIRFDNLQTPIASSNPQNVYEFCVEFIYLTGNKDPMQGCGIMKLGEYTLTGTSLSPISVEISQYSAYILTYTTSFAFVNNYNMIRIELPVLKQVSGTNYNLFELGLGVTGDPNCITSNTQFASTCSITPATVRSADAKAYIDIKQVGTFTTSSQTVRFVLKNPDSAQQVDYKITLGYLENNIFKVIGSVSGNFTPTSSSPGNWATSSVSRSDRYINKQTIFTFTLDSGIAAVNDQDVYIMLQFPSGWNLSTASTITVDLQTVDSYTPTIIALTNSYAPIIYFTAENKDFDTNSVTVTITGLINPSPVGTGTGSGVIITYTGSNSQALLKTTTSNLDVSYPHSIEAVGVDINYREANFPAAHYTFTFTNYTPIPENGKIKVSFPVSAYSDFSNFGCELNINLFQASHVCEYANNKVSFTQLAAVEADRQIILQVKWIPNPNQKTVAGFVIQTTDENDSLLDQITDISTTFNSYFAQGHATITDIDFQPNTQGAQNADFHIKFINKHFIPRNSNIQVTVPFDFVKLPDGECSMNVSTSSCQYSGSLVFATISEDVQPGSLFELYILGAFTIPLADRTGQFEVIITYKGRTIDQSQNEGATSQLITLKEAAENFELTKMYFYPSNQGLLATYVIEMISPTDISPEDKFVVWFPEEFDDTLTASSRRLECWGEPGSIVGLVYECNLKEFRRLEVSGIRNVSEGVPFSIYISNVRNPRIGKLGQFRFGLLQDDEFSYYLVNVGSLWVTSSPSTLLIKDLQPELPYARIRNSYTFDFNLQTDLPRYKDGGELWIQFPPQFNLPNMGYTQGWEYECSTQIFDQYQNAQIDWNPEIKCINYQSNRVQILYGDEIEARANRFVRITLKNINGQRRSTRTEPFQISIYDRKSRKLIETSNPLLSFPLSLTLPILGEEILVNDENDIYIRRGTGSNLITMRTKLDSQPMRVYLQLYGSMPKLSEAKIYPSNMVLWNVSEQNIQFRVSVPSDTTPGIYSLTWSKSGDDYNKAQVGDEIYAPVIPSVVVVTDEVTKIQISESIEVVQGGRGYPITVTLQYAPYRELYLVPFLEDFTNEHISFEPDLIHFKAGETQKTFVIFADEETERIKYHVNFDLGGVDETAYEIPDPFVFEVIEREKDFPVLSDINFTGQRLEVNFTMTVNKPCTLFYIFELQGTPVESNEEVIQRVYEGLGNYINVREAGNITFDITGLAAETNYILYAVVEDTSLNTSQTYTHQFSTLPDFQSCMFAVDFTEFNPDALTQTDQIEDLIKPEMAKAVFMNSNRLKIYSVQQVSSRKLQQIDTSSLSTKAVIIEVANDKYLEMLSPATIVSQLTISDVNKYMNPFNLSTQYITSPVEMENIAPAWIIEGNVWSVSGTSITCTGSLSDSGYLYIVVLDEGAPEPNAQQVVWGVDGHNVPARSVSAYYDKNSAAGYVTYTGLTAETKYDVYIAATNDYPGNNKAVVQGSFGYPGVRTDIVCSSNCDLYIIAEDDDYSMWLAVWILALVLV